MIVSQHKLLKVIQDRVEEIDESVRVPGYQKDLLDTLAQIIVLERDHLEARTQIQKKVDDKAHALATILLNNGWEPS